ncbi:hypothetical protein IHE44_0007369 [Lamprotornis superbus]|uniref:Dehydrogenase/reductase SDR family member 11 n=1 Tax=Lamprotornis superbus TaxID=245042 RepID=A0A835NX02_9PASS|nr:hypothetical protein IHE44_0007369 [Lamprotornis superbus]
MAKLAAECQSAGYPGTLIPYKCDLSNEEEILSMFSAIKTLHQGVDVCINNAGLARPEPLLSGKTEGWRTMIDLNFLPIIWLGLDVNESISCAEMGVVHMAQPIYNSCPEVLLSSCDFTIFCHDVGALF